MAATYFQFRVWHLLAAMAAVAVVLATFQHSLVLGCHALMSIVSVAVALALVSSPRTFKFLANATLIYPVLFLILLYGEWLLVWYVLGRGPSIFGDDEPKYINRISWIDPVTMIAFIGLVFALAPTVILNGFYIARCSARVLNAVVRIGIWTSLQIFIIWDPLQVLYWWLD